MKRQIAVKGTVYKIKRKKNLRHPSVGAANGVIDFENRIIWIDSSLKAEKFYHALLHEVFHASNYALRLNEEGGIDPAIEEVQSSGIPDVLLENFDIKLK